MIDPFQGEPTASRITLRDALTPLRRYRNLAVSSFFVTFALVNLVAWLWAANYYKAHMQVVVEQDRSDPVVTAGQDSAVGSVKQITTDQVSSEVALLKGSDMLQSAAIACGLVESPKASIWDSLFRNSPQQKQSSQVASATAKLARRLSVEAEPTSDVIEVSYGHRGNPETPACVLQQLAKLYLDKHLHLRRPAGAAILFAEQTDRYKEALAESEARIIEFSRANGSGDPEALKYALAQQLAMSEAALHRAQEATIAGESRVQDLQDQMQLIPQRSTAARQETAAYLLIQNLQGDLLNENLKRTQLLLKYEPSFPLVKEADQEIQQTKQALEEARKTSYISETTDRDPTFEALRLDLAKSKADIALSKANGIAIEASIAAMRRHMIRLEEQTIEKAALERNIKANETKYLLYLNKREQESTSDALDERRIADVAIAVPPAVPVLPAYNPSLIVAVGFLFSGIVALSIAYLAEYMDPFLRTPADVDRDIGLPVLAAFVSPLA